MKNDSSFKVTFTTYLILGGISALTPLAIDLYLPALPTLVTDLNAQPSQIQASLITYLIGFSFGQLIFGPLSDSYGRKPVLLLGITVFSLLSIIVGFAQNAQILVLGRLVQGFFAAAPSVVVFALVRDLYKNEDLAKTMSFIGLVVTIAPLIAPLLGGYLTLFFSWRSTFFVLAMFSIFILIIAFIKIPETLKGENRCEFRLKNIVRNFLLLLKNKKALGLISIGAFSYGGLFSFLSAGSFIYIELFGVALEKFGYYFGLNVLTLMVFTSLNGRFVKKVGLHKMLRIFLSIKLFAGICLLLSGFLGGGLWTIVPFVMIYIGTVAAVSSNSMAILLSSYPEMAGTASSLVSASRFGFGSLAGFLLSFFTLSSAFPMALFMSICAICTFFCYVFFARNA